jgi:hypothetical protein
MGSFVRREGGHQGAPRGVPPREGPPDPPPGPPGPPPGTPGAPPRGPPGAPPGGGPAARGATPSYVQFNSGQSGGPGGPPKSALGALPAGGPKKGPILGLCGCFYPSFAVDRTMSLLMLFLFLFSFEFIIAPRRLSGERPQLGDGVPKLALGGPPGGVPGADPSSGPGFGPHQNKIMPWGGSWGGPWGGPGGFSVGPRGALVGAGGPSRGGTPRGAPWWPPALRTLLPFWSRPPGGPPGGPFLGGPDSLGAKSS